MKVKQLEIAIEVEAIEVSFCTTYISTLISNYRNPFIHENITRIKLHGCEAIEIEI